MKILFGRLCVECLLFGALAGAAAAAAGPVDPVDIFRNITFRNIGPATVSGRISSIVGVPGKADTFYVGTASGGVWKTTSGGDRWTPVFEHQRTSSIGVVALAPSAPEQVWVGTGEPNIRNDVVDGAGVFFSPDGGKTWQSRGLDRTGQISGIVVDPADPDTVLVATLGNIWRPTQDRGVYRTTDGGKTWKKVLYVGDDTGAIDIKQVPGHPDVLFAAMWQVRRLPWVLRSGGSKSGLYRSTDGGRTWKKLTHGLPAPPTGRIGLAVAPSNPNHVYALIGSTQGVLWESIDMGDHWRMVSNDHALNVRPFYFSTLTVAPDDDNRVYFSALNLRESDDAGKTSRVIDKGVHVDHHALWIDPANPDFMVQGNDGGVFASRDRGTTWRFLDNLPIGQFYSVSIDGQWPFKLCGGLQDNGGWCGPSSDYSANKLTGASWTRIVSGDGHYVVPAWSRPTTIYADSQRGNIVRYDSLTGMATYVRPAIRQITDTQLSALPYRFNWTAPIVVSRKNPDEAYLGANVLFKTVDGGGHWQPITPDVTRNDKSKQVISGGDVYKDNSGAENYDTILAVSVADDHPDVIWVGTDDGLVQVTRDGGQHWAEVTPPGAPKWARISQIGVSPFDPGTAYVAVDAHELGDRTAYAYRTRDYGRTWVSMVTGVAPDVPVHVVREDPNRKGLLVMGTDTGLYYSHDAGDAWHPLAANFPTVPVLDLRFASGADSLAVATHGRGLFVLDNLRPLEYLPGGQAGLALAPAKPGVLIDRVVTRPDFDGAAYAVPNAPSGVTLSYLPGVGTAPPKGTVPARRIPVRVTITDAAGNAVATRSTTAEAGVVNEYVWDMRYDGPTGLKLMRGGPDGPRVLSGSYQATVAAGGESRTQTVQVLPDPRDATSPQEACRRLGAALRMRNDLSALHQLLNRVADMQVTLGDAQREGSGRDGRAHAEDALLAQGQALDRKLSNLKDSVYSATEQHDVPEDRIHGLYDLRSNLTSAAGFASRNMGETTTISLQAEMDRLGRELQARLDTFNHLLEGGVKAYDAAAAAAGFPTVKADGPIRVEPVPDTCSGLARTIPQNVPLQSLNRGQP